MSSAERRNSSRKTIMPYHLALRRYWRPLLGSAAAWFIYNYIAYPFGLFSSTISARVGAGDTLVKSYGWGTLINVSIESIAKFRFIVLIEIVFLHTWWLYRWLP